MEENDTYVKNDKFALGLVNGIIGYDIVWAYLSALLLQIVLQEKYFELVETKLYTVSLILMILTSLITLVVAILIASPKSLLKVLKIPKKEEIKIIFTSLGMMFLLSFMYNLVLLVIGIDISGGNANQSNVLTFINESPLLSVISMIILAPVLEEITYRYFLYGGIAKYNRKWAVIISGFVFMCVHAVASFTQEDLNMVRELLLLPPYLFSGIILAYSYDKTNNLAVSISIHTLNNLISFILSVL